MNILKFDWHAFDAVVGMKYVAGVAIMFALWTVFDFPWFAAGLSALLAWFTTFPWRRRDRLLGTLTYIGLGAALAVVVHLIQGTYWPWMVAMFLVAFGGTFGMILGMRGFMVGWCLICWFYVAPLVGAGDDIAQFLIAHLFGSGVVLALIALPMLWAPKNAAVDTTTAQAGETTLQPSRRFVVEYSTAVAVAMTIGLVLGDAWLETDPTLIVNATLMIIFPSLSQTWILAINRIIGAMLGIVVGFYFGLYIQHEWLEVVLWIVMSFFALAMLTVNAGVVTFCFLVIFAASWGAQGYEAANTIANERVFAEFVGVAIALIAVTVRNILGTPADAGGGSGP